MTGFNNSIVGGQGVLIRPSIHSPGYVTGSAGWSINRDGSAEFNNIVIRNGTVVSGQALYYSGPPAAGNLIASISATTGPDGFGNTVQTGVTTYDSSGDYVNLAGQTLFLKHAADFAAAQVNAGGGVAQLISGQSTSLDVAAELQLMSKLASVSGLNAQAYLSDTTGAGAVTSRLLEVAGSITVRDQLYVIQSGAEETWHSVSTLANSMTFGTASFFKYRRKAENEVMVAVRNLVAPAGGWTDGTTFVTSANGLPSAYRPVSTQRFIVDVSITKAVGGSYGMGTILVNTDGSFDGYGFAASTRIDGTFRMPLDV